ncbi:MAG TPA: monomeric [FeFe] hydrogenase, partial [bacterium]|nr:monomeric [FeFe] hydrogenase [bacterium]
LTEITIIKRKVLTLLCEALLNNEYQKIREIPNIISPDKSKSYSCCIHHDRAITRDRIKHLLGLNLNEFSNKSWNTCIDTALNTSANVEFLSVMQNSCHQCPQKRYYITEACQHCIAHPCKLNCPKQAITIQAQRAMINEELCVECSMCAKVCPYNAIIEVRRPCENACPVNAIKTNEDNIAEIDLDKCILCGRCLLSCPFGAIVEISDVKDLLVALKNKVEIDVMLAPAVVGQFSPKASLQQIAAGLKLLGFRNIYEVAEGADIVAELETQELIEKVLKTKKLKFLTTSCCPSFVYCIKKHFSNIKENISHTPSPMIQLAQMLKNKQINSSSKKIVFIGPCLSKKKEAKDSGGLVDFVLTFEELGCLFAAKKIDVASLTPAELANSATAKGRMFAIANGVTTAISNTIKQNTDLNFSAKLIDGINKENLKILKAANFGKYDFDFIEGMCCEGGCIAGPGVIAKPSISKKLLDELLK